MSSKIIVTIGIPVYNVEKYIHKCIDSALNQDFDRRFEILVIDDCGTDKSMEVVQNAIKVHPRGSIVRIIKHNTNRGLAEARNTIIKNATGDYIYFIDSDDYISSNTLSLLYSTAIRYDADAVYGSKTKQEEGKSWTDDDDIYPDKLFLKEGEFISYVYMTPHSLVPITVWNILFKASFLHENNLLFPNIRYQEDIAFNELYHPLVKKAVFLRKQTYFYTVRTDSLMNKIYREKIGIEEAYRAFQLCDEIKKTCIRWKGKYFYSGKCAVVMRNCFYDMAGLLKHKSQFSAPLPLKDVRNAMKHPESLNTIICFKHFLIENLFYYTIGILPPRLSALLITFVSKRKGFF